jgi:uncharacterized protein YacL
MKRKQLLQSLHWSIQQTAIILLSVLGFAVGLSNFADIMHASANGSSDWVTSAFMKMILGNAIGFILFLWYQRRRRVYLEEHKDDADNDSKE